MFKLISPYKPTGDQPQAIKKLIAGISKGDQNQVLLGVTGSGKTFTMANVIQTVQKPTLIISHNKTLAAQLYQEFRDYFPENAVSYFVSYYDYYQPEAYIPSSDTYIEKETSINDEIDKLRLATTTNLLTRKDVIVIASVSCIYNLGSPVEYGKSALELAEGLKVGRNQIIMRLNDLQYIRSEYDFHRSSYRIRGDIIDIHPAYEDVAIRIHYQLDRIVKLEKINSVSGEVIPPTTHHDPTTISTPGSYHSLVIYPAKHYVAGKDSYKKALTQIQTDLNNQVNLLKSQNKLLEAHRLNQRVNYDLEMIQELGYVNGIENYSRYFDGRKPGDPPYSLLDYFPKDYLLIIDESHITVPQIRGMYNGDQARKKTLIDFGFRLPSALDNRPLNFVEFMRRMGQTIYSSATPDNWEISMSNNKSVEQLVRPTGLIDPEISIRPSSNQIQDLILEIQKRVTKKQRVLVTTLTKRTAEDLSSFLSDKQIKVQYLHADIDTLERLDILADLRNGTYDVVVGINLLREGLDLPEVSLVAILDADKEGFLRSRTSLIQTMGRAARHIDGYVIMYADNLTGSMKAAIEEVSRRRETQIKYNKIHKITPSSIIKPFKEQVIEKISVPNIKLDPKHLISGKTIDVIDLDVNKAKQLTPDDLTKLIKLMTKQMNIVAKQLDFETAAKIRDRIMEIQELR